MKKTLLTHGMWGRFAILLLLVGALSACAKPQPTVVIVVGGLGANQLGEVREAVKKQCPGTDVVSAGWWNGYKGDVAGLATKKKRERVVLIGHSFGCRAIADAAEKLPVVDLAIFIEPAWSDIQLPRNVKQVMWYQRTDFDIGRRAKIVGAPGPVKIKGGHNDVPESPELISGVVQAINRLNTRQRVAGR